MKPQPNKQALASFEEQTVLHPSDIQAAALKNPFIHMLARMDSGDLVADAVEKLQKLVSACMILNKKGEMTIKIALAPGGMNQMELLGKITAKIPEGESPGTRLFCTPNGQLCAHDPNQPQFQQPAFDAVEERPARALALEPAKPRIIEMKTTAHGDTAAQQPADTAA